jgi:hypothetical protein
MILHSIAAAHGVISGSELVPAIRKETNTAGPPEEIRALLERGMQVLIHNMGNISTDAPNALLTSSSTWGHDDPLTLTWLAELLNANILDPTETQPIRATLAQHVETKLTEILAKPSSANLRAQQSDEYPVDHPFPLLRYIHLAKATKSPQEPGLPGKLQDVFLAALHTELSNSAIRDAGFDPACLVFALEGLYQVNPEAVTEPVVEKAIEVLGSSPSIGSHWRPVRPMTATSQGQILLPQSVEVANSYLRICKQAAHLPGEPLFSRSVEMLHSYAQYISSRVGRVKVPIAGEDLELWGWQSEHTYAREVVHLWATSQVALFLQHYAAMLDQHIARSSRVAAGLEFKDNNEFSPQGRGWAKKVQYEIAADTTAGNEFRPYTTINTRFVQPRLRGDEDLQDFSILLYGPPGTGKTTFAESLARAVDYHMITVTPSDFIKAG